MQERRYSEAAKKCEQVRQTSGSAADVLYALAACRYQLHDYKSAVENCETIETAAKDRPGCHLLYTIKLKSYRIKNLEWSARFFLIQFQCICSALYLFCVFFVLTSLRLL